MWEEVRARLNRSRHELGRTADAWYSDEIPRVAGTSLLCRPEWVPATPIPLDDIRLEWDAYPAPPAVTEPSDGLPEGFRTYAEAMAALAPPAVFENRPTYRLLHADLHGEPVLRLGPARYFDAVNVGEAVAHELAAASPGLPLRTRIGDPCDLTRRPASLAVTTVTVKRSGSYVLHWRDPGKVAHAGGLYQVMPVGVFQPLTGGEDGRGGHEDLGLWRCMVREFSEELLGTSEDYRPGFDQESWPFHRTLNRARAQGRLRVHCLGLGVDPLTLAVDLLTVAVFDDALFDDLFGGLVAANAEGSVRLVPFDGTVPSPMQPAGAAALGLAWRHRSVLLR